MPKMKQKAPGTRKAKIGEEVLVNVILDRSGSMLSLREATIGGYNEYLKGLRADKETRYNVSLTQFDTNGQKAEPELTVSYIDKPLGEVADLDLAGYEPRGGTPLYDAIGETLRRVEAKGRPVLNVIITDGMENASKEFTQESIKRLIAEKEKQGHSFVFLGANIDSYQVGRGVGVQISATANYQPTPHHTKMAFAAIGASTRNYAANRRDLGTVSMAIGESFLSDTQKAGMGDLDLGKGTVGGGPAASVPFPSPESQEPEKRRWNVGK